MTKKPGISPKKLAELEKKIADAKAAQEKALGDYNEARDEAFSLMDAIYGEGIAARIATDSLGELMIIAREYTPKECTPSLDVSALEQNLTPQLWIAVTDPARIFNEEKLAARVEAGEIPVSLVELITTYKEPTPRLAYKEATKQERIVWEHQQRSQEEAKASA